MTRRILTHPEEYGRDWSNLPDFNFQEITGWACLAEDIIWRLSTPRGSLFYDAGYGCDIRQWLHSMDSDELRFDIASSIEAELIKDPRILESTADISALSRDELVVELTIETADGPFGLILSATAAAVALKGGALT